MKPTLRSAFDTADELTGAERAAFLHALAAEDPTLHAQVRALLEAGAAAPAGFLACVAFTDPNPVKTGERVGPFIVTGELGRGGFSVVQRARQETPVRREVALKRLSISSGAPAVLARFEAERQTLAGLSHPHIARFFDAGNDTLGQPWFAMQLVEGSPVTTYVKSHRLSGRDIVALFLPICAAVTHAHRQGVIHRDLKPSNLLVDATGHAWVIDFGIAKLLEQIPLETADLTLAGQMIGTPLYMAPERFDGASDTRSDVYALGILLTELLLGRPARTTADFWQHGPHAWARHLRDHPLPAPGLDPDIDAILLKASDADPARRYGSVQEFADDLQAWREHRAVIARAPTFWYQSCKYLRRHRLVLSALSVALAGLIAGLLLALQSASAARAGRAAAEVERDRATGVTRALSILIASANPEESAGQPAPTMAEALDRFSARLPATIEHRPQVEQDVRLVLGEAWLGQGRLEKAETEFHRVAALENITGLRRGEAALGLAVIAARRNDHPKAARLLADAATNAAPGDTPTGFYRLLLAAHMDRHNGDHSSARGRIDEAMRIIARENYETTEPAAAAKAWRALAWLEKDAGNLPAAEQAARKLVQLAERARSPTGTALPEAQGILAEIILAQRPDPAALRMLEQSWRAFATQYGEGHSFTLGFRLSLATCLNAAGRADEARAHAAAIHAASLALPFTDPERQHYIVAIESLLASSPDAPK